MPHPNFTKSIQWIRLHDKMYKTEATQIFHQKIQLIWDKYIVFEDNYEDYFN